MTLIRVLCSLCWSQPRCVMLVVGNRADQQVWKRWDWNFIPTAFYIKRKSCSSVLSCLENIVIRGQTAYSWKGDTLFYLFLETYSVKNPLFNYWNISPVCLKWKKKYLGSGGKYGRLEVAADRWALELSEKQCGKFMKNSSSVFPVSKNT